MHITNKISQIKNLCSWKKNIFHNCHRYRQHYANAAAIRLTLSKISLKDLVENKIYVHHKLYVCGLILFIQTSLESCPINIYHKRKGENQQRSILCLSRHFYVRVAISFRFRWGSLRRHYCVASVKVFRYRAVVETLAGH